ncbi:Protein XAP5 CIRCADIAN TIMEKEEPER [Glycine soja]|nr:Protein XAP5 CIRCADIAN TIMEKEEPER [Glycine max]
MSGMGDGYVGTAQDAVRIRRLEKQREAERRKIQELKTKSASAKDQPGLLQFGSSTSEILETAFKKETVGLVTREQYVEKRVNIQSKIEEEEKEKLQKQQQEYVFSPLLLLFHNLLLTILPLQTERRSFNYKSGKRGRSGAILDCPLLRILTMNPKRTNHITVRVCVASLLFPFLFLSLLAVALTFGHRSAEDSCSVSERLRSKLSVKGCANSGFVSRSKFEVRKGDSIGEFLRAVQQQLAPEFREIRTTSVENLLYVKEDLIIPHQHSFYELIVNKARGKSGPLFHFDVHEDVRTIADATIEKDESHAGKVVERHWYEKNKHIFPASRWEIYDPTKKWERYTIHGD